MDTYFQQLNQTLKNHQRAVPFLLIDLDQLDQNIATLQANLNPKAKFRIVVKSLPCWELIDHVMQRAGTHQVMVFHQPFLTDLISRFSEEEAVLLGKPMPIKTATYFYENLPSLSNGFDPFRQIQWLVDTEQRILEYLALAKKIGQPLRLNLEIDVGLHRGGFVNKKALSSALKLLVEHQEVLRFSGLMGYDAHVTKLPQMIRTTAKALQLANQFYEECKTLIRHDFPDLWNDELTFNGAGSPTISLHQNNSPLNDLSAGSCLVKPTTFDIPTLTDYSPASYIATPILKSFEGTTLPVLEKMKGLINLIHPSNRQSYFIYGGFWKADYCYPKGVRENALFGASTNQTMLNAPKTVKLNVDDFVFLRPHQSEFVFLQFGKILAISNGKIIGEWQVLKN